MHPWHHQDKHRYNLDRSPSGQLGPMREKDEAPKPEGKVMTTGEDGEVPKGWRFDPFADARMGKSLFQMRPEDWLIRDEKSPKPKDSTRD
jgi:hypothetical protein